MGRWDAERAEEEDDSGWAWGLAILTGAGLVAMGIGIWIGAAWYGCRDIGVAMP